MTYGRRAQQRQQVVATGGRADRHASGLDPAGLLPVCPAHGHAGQMRANVGEGRMESVLARQVTEREELGESVQRAVVLRLTEQEELLEGHLVGGAAGGGWGEAPAKVPEEPRGVRLSESPPDRGERLRPPVEGGQQRVRQLVQQGCGDELAGRDPLPVHLAGVTGGVHRAGYALSGVEIDLEQPAPYRERVVREVVARARVTFDVKSRVRQGDAGRQTKAHAATA